MKKTVLAIFFLLFAFIAGAQEYTEIKTSQLPKATRDYFTKKMPDAKITRAAKVDDNGTISYLVSYSDRGRKHVLQFDKDGTFIGKGDKLVSGAKSTTQAKNSGTTTTTTKEPGKQTPPSNTGSSSSHPAKVIPVEKLPADILTYLKTNIPSGEITQARQLTINEVPIYQVKVKDGKKEHVITFNGKGKYLSKRSYDVKSDQQKENKPTVKEEKKEEKSTPNAIPGKKKTEKTSDQSGKAKKK
ncbi:MAG TPA: PepSY-like domain-containing protein [Bacteroidales bacterium]|nr:PepSY-like domain-containing protein [Bacteroidales bacterium]